MNNMDYLEETLDQIKMQNLVLATAFKSLISALPTDIAPDVIDDIRHALDEQGQELEYRHPHQADLFHDAVQEFFGENQ